MGADIAGSIADSRYRILGDDIPLLLLCAADDCFGGLSLVEEPEEEEEVEEDTANGLVEASLPDSG